MSCLFMPKKLKQLPSSSKKAWKSFTSLVSSPRLHGLHNRLKPVTKATCRLLNTLPFKRRSHGARLYYNKYANYYNDKPISTVYVDRLFDDDGSSNTTNNSLVRAKPETTTMGEYSSGGNGSNSKTGQVKWKEYVSKLPHLRGVDERADNFILRFRQQMQLQREQSIVEFQEMLA